MGGEEGAGALVVCAVEVLDDGPGDTEAVVGAGAPADFIKDDEGTGGGVVEDVGRLVHLDHEGGVAAGEFVTGADTGEDTVDSADAAGVGRYPGACVRHQGDEGGLADIGRFTGHVGAGKEGNLLVGSGKVAVVGDEGGVGVEGANLIPQGLLDDGVAGLFDVEVAAVLDAGPAIVPLAGDVAPACKEVDFGEVACGLVEFGGVLKDLFYNVPEEFFLPGDGAFFGVEDFLFFDLEFLGVVALCVGEGLFADVVVRDEGDVGFADFDEVAEGAVVLDAEVFDAGALLLFGLEVGEPGLVVGAKTAEVVEVLVVVLADVAAVPEVVGEFVGDGFGEEAVEFVESAEVFRELGGVFGLDVAEELLDFRELGEGVPDAADFTGVLEAVLEAAEDALDVADFFELFPEVSSESGNLEELFDEGLAAFDFFELQRRGGEVLFEEAGTSGSEGGVHGFHEAALAGVFRSTEDFEAADGGRIHDERLIGAVFLDLGQVFGPGAERMGRVLDEGGGAGEGRVVLRDAESLEVAYAEGFLDSLGRLGWVEIVVAEFGDGVGIEEVVKVLGLGRVRLAKGL